MVLMCLFPLSGDHVASFPHVLELSGYPPAPNPILESQVTQLFSLLPRMPILALEEPPAFPATLKPSLLHLRCKEACEPISFFHVLRPNEMARYCPSAIIEYRELAALVIAMNLICWPIFIPRQILEKGVFQ